MSKTHNDGGPAFPMPSGDEPRVDRTTHYNEGMTLRDYFAGQVIAGIMASSVDTMRAIMAAAKRDGATLDDGLAGGAYELADAMLKAREQ